VEAGTNVTVDNVVLVLHLNQDNVAFIMTSEMVDNEAINDSQSTNYVDEMQPTNGANDTQVANVLNELTHAIDGPTLDTLKEMSSSKTSMPTGHDTP
jgi:hypothetical protein